MYSMFEDKQQNCSPDQLQRIFIQWQKWNANEHKQQWKSLTKQYGVLMTAECAAGVRLCLYSCTQQSDGLDQGVGVGGAVNKKSGCKSVMKTVHSKPNNRHVYCEDFTPRPGVELIYSFNICKTINHIIKIYLGGFGTWYHWWDMAPVVAHGTTGGTWHHWLHVAPLVAHGTTGGTWYHWWDLNHLPNFLTELNGQTL
jgi:hypothetical protein